MSAGCGASGPARCTGLNRRRSGRPRPADRLQPGGQWQRAVGRLRRVERAVDERRADEELRRRWPEREPPVEADGDRRNSSRFVRARIARVASSSGHASTTRPIRTVSSLESRARTIDPLRRRPRPDRLREPFAVVLDEADGAPDDGRRAAVVHDEVGPAQARQRRRRATGRGARPRVASRRWTDRRRRRRRRGSPAPRGAARAGAAPGRDPAPRRRGDARTGPATAARTAGDDSRSASARATRSSKSSPPVAATARSYSTNVRAVGPASSSAATCRRSRPGPASGARSPCRAPASRPGRPPAPPGAGSPSGRRAAPRRARVAQDLEAQRVERSDADGAGLDAQRLERGREPPAQLLRGAAC